MSRNPEYISDENAVKPLGMSAEEQQQWLIETAKEAGEVNNATLDEQEAGYLQKMKDEGVTVVEPTEEVLAGFREKSKAFYDKGASFGWSDGLYDTVRKAMGAQ